MHKLPFLLATVVALAAACVDNSNPDQGKLARYLCYQVDTPGDPNSRNPKLSIVITQDNLDIHDAANFVPGNKLASEFGTQTIPFTVQVYKSANMISSQSDPKLYALDLLSERADSTYHGQGGRIMNAFSIYWDDFKSYVYFKAEDPNGSAFVVQDSASTQKEHRHVWCDAPWAIPSIAN